MADASPQKNNIVTASMLVIGDEILSGRTQDKNVSYLANRLGEIGIQLKEVRIVTDDEDEIVGAINHLREKYNYVFTSGGIGPTHDDITADSVAKAFGVSIDFHPQAMDILTRHYEKSDLDFNDARKRMARIPDGASLIDNPVSKAPGFRIENVHVMAGVPAIMQAMTESLLPDLQGGAKMKSRTLNVDIPEGKVAEKLGALQERYPEVSMGSYPYFRQGAVGTNLVLRSTDQDELDQAIADLLEILKEFGCSVTETT